MSKNTYHQYLKQVPLFSDLDDDELDEVAQKATDLDLKAGSVIMREGATAHEMVIVVRGTLEVTRGDEHIADIGPGGFAGEMALIARGPPQLHRHREDRRRAAPHRRPRLRRPAAGRPAGRREDAARHRQALPAAARALTYRLVSDTHRYASRTACSTLPSAWRAKRAPSRPCTGSSLSHGQPPNWVRW